MSPPVRAHLISLSLVLGLTVSLVWGQAPTHFTLNSITVTGPIPITSVGRGTEESRSLICRTTSVFKTSSTVWLFPNGSLINQEITDVTATDTFIFHRKTSSDIVLLRRGPSVLSPGGEYCCGSATNVNERLCIILVVDCGPPPSISNGSLGTTTNTTLGWTVTYTCTNGYQISPGVTMATASCMATGNWETVPTCLVVECGTPPSISNGSLGTPTNETFEGTVTYTCDNGYQISPGITIATASCLATGNWVTVICLAMCPDLQPLMNGSITYQPAGTVQLEGTNATHNCTSGYRLSGGPVRVCQSDRTWSGKNIKCSDVESENMATAAAGVVVGVLLVVILVIILVVMVIILVFRRSHKKRRYERTGDPHSYSTTYNKTSTGEHSTAIQKLIDPSIVEFPSDMKATEGEEVYLKVKVTGHPPPTITWYCNGTAVMADYATELDEDGGISFPSIEIKHSGIYKMVVTGPSGACEEKQLELTVFGEGERTHSGDSGIGPSDYNPVSVSKFGTFVNECHGNSNKKFFDLYKSLDSGENGHSTIMSKQNRDSNRFGNISVYDDNMIVLQPITGQEDCQSNYINASYVDGYSVTKKFIAAQAPVPCTLVDFWRMIWQERPTTIVMLTNLKEGKKIKCEPYWPESGKMNFGPFTVTITDQQVFADYTVRTLKLSLAGDSRALKVTQFHFTSWPDHGVPDYATPVLAFHRRVRSHHNPSKGPLLVHCSAGVGRTGTYLVIDNVLEQIEAEKVVDISGAIVRARNQRMKLVQTEKQYIFIHDAILEFVMCGNTQISAGDLRKSMQKLSRKDPTKHITGFEQQFKILEQVSPNPNEMNCVTANRYLELNRGNKFLPSENSRLILRGEQPDYINAVFAHGYKHQKAFIIAQNPLPSTVRNFWKVIYDRKCAAVVMLSPIVENKKEVCSQYWPRSGIGSYGEYTVENLGEESIPGFTIRSLSVHDKKSKSSHQVTQFHVTNWTEDGVIANLKAVTDVNEEVVKVQRRTGNKPILVHCTDTVTRSGIFCAISTTIDRCKSEGIVDVFQVVKALRIHKPGAVPTEEVYQIVFDAVLTFLDSFDTYANFN